MATFLDIAGLSQFSHIFVFIFVWLVVYAILSYTHVLGNNHGINIIIGLVIALLVLFSPLATGIIQNVAPWVAVIFIFIMFLNIAMKMFGGGGESLASLRTITMILIFLTIIVGSLSYVRSNVTVPGDNETDADYSEGATILFHPKVLGIIFIMILAIFTIVLMAGKQY